MTPWIKCVVAAVFGVVSFVVGYQYAAALYGEDIAELREDYARRSVELQEEYREKEREQYNSLVHALEERDKALARVNNLSGDVERVRKQAADARGRLSAISSDTCSDERKQLARSAELLERCGCLLARGVNLSARTAIDKDAVVKIVNE